LNTLKTGEKTHKTLGAIVVASVVAALVTYTVAIAGAILAFLFTPLGPLLQSITGEIHLGAFFVLDWPSLINSNYLVFCYCFVAIFVLSFIAGIRNENGLVWGLAQLRQGSRPIGLPNWLAVMPLLSSSLLVIVIVLTLLLNSVGVPSGGLPTPTTQRDLAREFAVIIYAPIREEMAIRITVIGVIDGIIVLIRVWWNRVVRAKPYGSGEMSKIPWVPAFLSAIYSPEKAKSMVGLRRVATAGWRGIHWTEWILLIFTSAIFGLLHVLSGAGWENGKAVTAGLSGFVLGLVYLSYGAYANILLHWFFNFYIYVFTLPFFKGLFLGFALTMDLIIFFLTIFLGVLGIIVGIVWLRDRPQPNMRPTPYSTVTVQS
jgi:hypothetical protein